MRPAALLLFLLPLFAQIPADQPAHRLNESWWARRHSAILAALPSHRDAELLLLGDSITQNYEKPNPPDEDFRPAFQRFYAPRRALNLGYSGDTTSHLLWRLDNGEVDNLHPKAALLLIGTNNTASGQSAPDVTRGIQAVIAKLQSKLPGTAIVLLALLPSDVSPAKSAADAEVNRNLARLYESTPGVTFLDIGAIFFRNGRLDETLFYDPRLKPARRPLHPDTLGQRLMAQAIEPTLLKLLNDAPRQYLASLDGPNTALIPVPWLERDSYDWPQRHRDALAARDTLNPEIVLIGDSITHFWGGPPAANHVNGPASWNDAFAKSRVLNLGFGWDRTQNVLWRLHHGEFDNLHPRLVILHIGTNNLTGTANARSNTPDEIVAGILAIRAFLRQAAPDARLVIMKIFPRGFAPDAPLREPIRRANEILAAALAAYPDTTLLDVTPKFLTPQGELPRELMNDGVHPTDKGYALWVETLREAGVLSKP